MEKLRAKWTIEMVKHHKTSVEAKNMNDPETASEHGGISDAYEQVIRDTEGFNEGFSKVIAEVTEFHRREQEAERMNKDMGNDFDAHIHKNQAACFKYILDKLERLNQGKEVRT